MQVLLVEFIPRQNMFKPDWKKNWKTPPSPLFILARLLLLQSSSQNLGNLDKICQVLSIMWRRLAIGMQPGEKASSRPNSLQQNFKIAFTDSGPGSANLQLHI